MSFKSFFESINAHGVTLQDDVSDVVEDDLPCPPGDMTGDLAMGSGDYLRSNSTRRRH